MSDEVVHAALLLAKHNLARARRVLANPGAGRAQHNAALDALYFVELDLQIVSDKMKPPATEDSGAGS